MFTTLLLPQVPNERARGPARAPPGPAEPLAPPCPRVRARKPPGAPRATGEVFDPRSSSEASEKECRLPAPDGAARVLRDPGRVRRRGDAAPGEMTARNRFEPGPTGPGPVT